MNRRRTNLSRRQWMRGAAGAALVSPLIPLLGARAATAAKRLILFYSPDGLADTTWQKAASGAYTPSHYLTPLAAEHASDIVLVGGLRNRNGGAGQQHAFGMAGLWTAANTNSGGMFDGGNGKLTGWGNGTSVDQVIARRLNAMGTPDRYKSIELAVQPGEAHIFSRMIYDGPNKPITPEHDPYAFFDRIFADAGVEAAELERLRAQRKSVIDLLEGELADLDRRTDAADKAKVEAHLEGVRSIERRLATEAGACSDRFDLMTRMGSGATRINITTNDTFPAVGELQMDLLVQAMSCGLTRVGSIQFSRSISGVRHGPWVPGLTEHHHYYSHNAGSEADKNANLMINEWYAKQFGYLLERLASVPEGDGTMLDNTLVVWGREMGIMGSHGMDPVPYVVAGGAGRNLQRGRYIHAPDADHPRLLVSIAQLMGLDDINAYGELDSGTGPLQGLV